MFLMIFSFVVLCALVGLVVYAFIQLGIWPGNVAKTRGHKYPDAVTALSWGGLVLTGGLGWLAALVWAYAAPRPTPSESASA